MYPQTGKYEKFGANMPMFNMLNKLDLQSMIGLTGGEIDGEDSLHVTPHLCLSVRMNIETKDLYHIGLSAMTGSVTDVHDIHKFETRYIDKNGKSIDDSLFTQEKYSSSKGGWFSYLYWWFIIGCSVGLIAETFAELHLLKKHFQGKMHINYCVNEINKSMQVSYLLQACQFMILIFSFHVKALLVNLPLLVIRGQRYMTDNVLLKSYDVNRRVFWFKTTFKEWLWCRLVFLVFALLYNVWRLFHV